MIKIVKETVIKTFRENDILVETIMQFHYSSEEDKLEHKKLIEAEGFKDSGQVQENIGTLTKPNYVWFGSYYKYETITR